MSSLYSGDDPQLPEIRAQVRAELEERSRLWGLDPTNVAINGAQLILEERRRQALGEGWLPVHDDGHVDGQLAHAGIAYADAGVKAQIRPDASRYLQHGVSGYWPWDRADWKPSDDPIKNLVRAGALIAAEIDRLLRLREEK